MLTDKIKNKAEAKPATDRPPRCDVLLFVTTAEERKQLEIVAREFKLTFTESRCQIGEFIDLDYVGVNRVLAVNPPLGSLRYRGTAWQAITFQEATGAKSLISVGMAFGTRPQEQKPGDVLVSTHIVPYDERIKKTEDGQIVTDYSRATKRRCKISLLRTMEQQGRKLNNLNMGVKVHFGALLSGSARIYSSLYRDHLVKAFSELGISVVGGDMEGVALASASPPKKPLWIVVKGISDFADEERNKIIGDSRPTACANAFKFLFQTLRTNRA